jgi:UDP-N-acetylmuramoyl-tripeptide--D-alanyl-D-alanine ligase
MTNIGVSHIEQLGSQENILKEKLHIQDGMKEDGCLFLNGDDPLLSRVKPEMGRKAYFYGFGENCDFRGEDLHTEDGYPVFTAVHGGERAPLRLKVMGSHMVTNALAALAVASHYGIPMEEAAKPLENFGGYKGRQNVFEHGGVKVIDDSYNASPVSMKAGLEVLSSAGEGMRKIAVLGDMKELGPDAPAFHREVGEYIAAHPIDCLVLLGEMAGEIRRGMEEKGFSCETACFSDIEQVKNWLDEHVREGDCILFKASNSMGLSKAVAHLTSAHSLT